MTQTVTQWLAHPTTQNLNQGPMYVFSASAPRFASGMVFIYGAMQSVKAQQLHLRQSGGEVCDFFVL